MFGLNFLKKTQLPSSADALPGREQPIPTAQTHFVNGAPLKAPFGEGMETAIFGLGCFWGAERKFWQVPGVVSTAVGYAAGITPNPTYEEVCSGLTGHNEVVLVAYDPSRVSYEELLRVFFEAHNPTQGMRQGNDVGTQYRSGIYVTSEPSARRPSARRRPMATPCAGPGTATRSRRKSSTRRSSTTPRPTISNISPRTRAAIAAWVGRA